MITKIIPINTKLVTKDGFKVGNALITDIIKIPTLTSVRWYHKIVTDYGNDMNLTSEEVCELFHLNGLADEAHKNFVHHPSILEQ
jgi:hypothetical protein